MNCSTPSTGTCLRRISRPLRISWPPVHILISRQFSMMTSGAMSNDRISSPLGISFSSALAIAAAFEVSIPAARCRCAKRSRTTSTGVSTNHLRTVSLDAALMDNNYKPFVTDLRNLIPWFLSQQRVIAFDDDEPCTRRDANPILHWILCRMVEARCGYTQILFTLCSNRRRL